MASQTQPLNEKLKNLGFARGNRMRLHGEMFEIAGEPIVVTETLVLVDAIEMASAKPRRLRVPLPVLRMASGAKEAS